MNYPLTRKMRPGVGVPTLHGRHRYYAAIVLCISCLVAARASADEQLEAGELRVVQARAMELAERFGGAAHVLVVFDLDNTLLASERHLGSDQWFLWQAALLEHAPESKYLVADDTDALLRIWAGLISRNRMRLTDTDAPAVIRVLGGGQFPLLVLTARSPELRPLTLRSLNGNDLSVKAFAFQVQGVPSDPFDPFEGISLDHEFTPSERLRFHIGPSRPVEYVDGVCLGNGQDKGVLLRLLLRRSKADIKAILFVDDQERNTNAVFDALRDTSVDATTIRFSREDDRVVSFLRGDKQRVHRQWRYIARRLEVIGGKRTDNEFLHATSTDGGGLLGSSPSRAKR